MQTTDRMMIAGLALQGLLANTLHCKSSTQDKRMVPNPYAEGIGEPKEIEESFHRPMNDAELTVQREALVHEALLITAVLEGKTPDGQGEPLLVKIVRICSVAYHVYRAARPDDVGPAAWADVGDDDKQLWYDAVNALLQGSLLISASYPLSTDNEEPVVRTGLNGLACQVINAVVAGWLDAE